MAKSAKIWENSEKSETGYPDIRIVEDNSYPLVITHAKYQPPGMHAVAVKPLHTRTQTGIWNLQLYIKIDTICEKYCIHFLVEKHQFSAILQ